MSAAPVLLPDPTPEVNVDSVFGDAGGLNIRGRLFFLAGAEHVKRDVRLPAPVTVLAETLSQLECRSFENGIPFSQNVAFFLYKLDWRFRTGTASWFGTTGTGSDSAYNNTVIGAQYLVDRTVTLVDRSHAWAGVTRERPFGERGQ